MEEYIRLEKEKAQKRGKVFNWETAKYGKIWYDEDIHDLRSVETEFPTIAFNDGVSSKTLSCEPTVSSLNDEIDFRISFDDFDDEDYTVVFDKNSFSYKIIFVNDLKMDSKNDNEKVNMPSFLPPSPSLITEYLVNISKRRAFWSLNEDILKINDSDNQYAVSIKEDTAYPCLHSPKTTKETRSIRRIQRRPIRRIGDIVCEYSGRYQTWMDDPNITMDEYIRVEEEKAQKRGKVFNWETAKYGKIWYDEDIHDLRSVETEFPAIAFNDGVSSEKTLSCEPTVSSLNDEIDFRVSLRFDDERLHGGINTAYPGEWIRRIRLPVQF
ncbi:hypothetical protein Tco_0086565 [Tanacetum coccineum]